MDAFTTFLRSIRDTAAGVQALATNLDLLVLAVPPNSASPIIEEHTDRQPRPGDIQIRHALDGPAGHGDRRSTDCADLPAGGRGSSCRWGRRARRNYAMLVFADCFRNCQEAADSTSWVGVDSMRKERRDVI